MTERNRRKGDRRLRVTAANRGGDLTFFVFVLGIVLVVLLAGCVGPVERFSGKVAEVGVCSGYRSPVCAIRLEGGRRAEVDKPLVAGTVLGLLAYETF